MDARWSILLALFVARTALAFQFQTVGTVAPDMIRIFDVDYTGIGTLIGLYLLPGAFVAIPSGVIGQRFGAKRMVLVGLFLMAAGGVLTACPLLTLIVVGRLVSGIGGVLLNVLMTKMVTDWFANREIVVAMSIFVASWPLGLALGLVVFPAIHDLWSWQGVMMSAAMVSFASFLLVALSYRAPPDVEQPAERFRISLNRRETTLVIVAGLIWGIYNAGYIVLVSFLPELFVARGFDQTEASRLVSLLGWVLIISVPLSGYVAQRLGRPNTQMALGFAAVACAATVIPFTGAPLLTFAVIALLAGLPAGLIMALPPQALSQENRAVGMGVYYAVYYACMALLPAFAGRARDLVGSSGPSQSAALMMVFALAGLLLFRTIQRRPCLD